jgi:hypothetical protein
MIHYYVTEHVNMFVIEKYHENYSYHRKVIFNVIF